MSIRYSMFVSMSRWKKVLVEGQAATGWGSLVTGFLAMNMVGGNYGRSGRIDDGSSRGRNRPDASVGAMKVVATRRPARVWSAVVVLLLRVGLRLLVEVGGFVLRLL